MKKSPVDSNAPATKQDIARLESIIANQAESTKAGISELAEIMSNGIAFLSDGLGKVENRLDKVENRLDKVETKLDRISLDMSEVRRRLLDVEVDTPPRKSFLDLKRRLDQHIANH